MTPASGTPRWVVPIGGLLFVVLFLLAQVPGDTWFMQLGAYAFLGVLFDLFMIFLAAVIAAVPLLRRFGQDPTLRRRLTRAFCIGYWLVLAVSFLLVANLPGAESHRVVMAIAALVKAAVGALLILGGVALCARLFKRRSELRARLSPKTDLTGETI